MTPKRGRWSRVPQWLRRVLLYGPLAIILLTVIAYIQTDVPRPEQLGIAQTTVVLYADGVEEVGRVGPENRTQVALSAVPLPVQQAVLSAENREYYAEPGVSPTGIGRALITNVRGGEVQQGGSTITQQYAKIAILQDSSRTYLRKFRELFVAVKLDQTYSKDQILEWYLNTVYFGRGAYGVKAAAETYFGKDIADLTVEEGAVLAALIASPGNNDPATSPEEAQDRFDYVLDGMVTEGWLSPADRADMSLPEVLPVERPNRLEGQAGYLVREVEVELERRGFTEDQINRGGLRVTTTIDKRAQDAAVEAIDDVLPSRDADLLPSLAAIEPGTGRVKALYGGPDYVERQLNSATQGRAPAGSAFKPFVLAAALEQGWSLRSGYDGNSPGSFGGGYNPRNAGGQDYGRVDLVTATQESVNTAYVGLADDLELQTVADTARAAGIESEVPADQGLSIALGGPVFVTPLEMAEAYATFAARGTHADSFVVERVEAPNGSVLYQAEPRTDQAFSTDTADDATYAMERVVTSGTGTRARMRDGRDVAGKTGTATDEEGDTLAVWFAGYTPQLAVSVSVFREDNQPIDGIADSVSGGRIPAAIFKAFADAALEDTDRLSFEPPVFGGSNRGGEVASESDSSDDEETTSTPRPRRTSSTSRPSSPRPSPRSPRTRTAEPEQDSDSETESDQQEDSSGGSSGGGSSGGGSDGGGSDGGGSDGEDSGGSGSDGQNSGQGRSGQSERDSGG